MNKSEEVNSSVLWTLPFSRNRCFPLLSLSFTRLVVLRAQQSLSPPSRRNEEEVRVVLRPNGHQPAPQAGRQEARAQASEANAGEDADKDAGAAKAKQAPVEIWREAEELLRWLLQEGRQEVSYS